MTTKPLEDFGLEVDLNWLNYEYGDLSPGEQKLTNLTGKLWEHIQRQDKLIQGLSQELKSLSQCVNVNDRRLDNHDCRLDDLEGQADA